MAKIEKADFIELFQDQDTEKKRYKIFLDELGARIKAEEKASVVQGASIANIEKISLVYLQEDDLPDPFVAFVLRLRDESNKNLYSCLVPMDKIRVLRFADAIRKKMLSDSLKQLP